jgi:hypothetical protein
MAAIEVINSQSGTINGNVATRYQETDNADIDVVDCTGVAMSGNMTEGIIHVTNTPHVTVDGNSTGGVSVVTSPNAAVTNTTVKDGQIVLGSSSKAIISGNTLTTEDDGTESSWAIHLAGTMTKPVVRGNTYQGIPNGGAGTIVDFGIIIDDTVTEAKLGWNDLTEAATPILDNGIDTIALDAIPISFGIDKVVLTIGTGLQPFPYSGYGAIMGARAVVGSAPTGADLTVNVNVNGGSIFDAPGDVPTITAGTTDSGFTKSGVSDQLVDGDVLTVDIITVGSTVAGGHLTVIVYVRPDGM